MWIGIIVKLIHVGSSQGCISNCGKISNGSITDWSLLPVILIGNMYALLFTCTRLQSSSRSLMLLCRSLMALIKMALSSSQEQSLCQHSYSRPLNGRHTSTRQQTNHASQRASGNSNPEFPGVSCDLGQSHQRPRRREGYEYPKLRCSERKPLL